MARKKKDAAPPEEKKGRSAKPETAEMLRSRDIQKIRVTKEIPVPMSEEEFTRDAMALAEAEQKLAEKKTAFNVVAEKYRADTKDLRKEVEKLYKAITSRRTMKSVEAIEERIFATLTIRWLDAKTGAVLDEKPMPPEMLQRDFVEESEAGERVDED